MLAAFIVAFREALEVALLIGVVVRYLTQTERVHFHKTVWQGLIGGAVLSVVFGYILFTIGGEFSEEGKEVLEIGASIVSILLIGTFLFWIKHHQTAVQITGAVESNLIKRERLGLFILILLSVLREGSETALFTFASNQGGRGGVAVGIVAGAVLAGAIGFILFNALAKVPIKKLFTLTSAFLIILAASMSKSVAGELIAETALVEWGVWVVVVVGGAWLLFRDEKKKVLQKTSP